MSRIKLLFAPENVGFANRLSSALADGGHETVTLDEAANAVLVIWSQGAAASREILSIAREALARRVLIPVALGKSPPPASFEHLWPMDLSGWSGAGEDPRWRFVLDEVELAVRRGVEVAPTSMPSTASPGSDGAPRPDPAAIGANLEDLFEESHTYYADARPRPRIPLAAMFAGFAVLGAASAGAFLAGRQAGGEIAPAAPIIAFVEPENQPADYLSPSDGSQLSDPAAEIASLESVSAPETSLADAASTSATSPAGFAAHPPETLRDGDVAIAALSEPAPVVRAPPLAPMLKSQSASGAQPAAAAAPAENSEPDAIAGLAWNATSALANSVAEPESGGRYLRDCVDCPDLAEMPPPPGLANGFAIGVREVTNRQWSACVSAGFCPALSGAGADNLPVTGVSYADALAFAAWISARTGRRYRLPSEAEWVAASDLSSEPADPSRVNLAIEGGVSRRLTPSGAFPPNRFGLYDIQGNVWEWTMACGESGADGDSCGQRIIKGGAYNTPASAVTAATRVSAPVDMRRADTGFRIARDLP